MSLQVVTEEIMRSFIDQKLCEMATVILRYYNPCRLTPQGCAAGEPNPCCVNDKNASGMCQFFMGGACQYTNCDCRLWLCDTAVRGTDEKCVRALRLLEEFAAVFDLVRPPLIGDPYVGADKCG